MGTLSTTAWVLHELGLAAGYARQSAESGTVAGAQMSSVEPLHDGDAPFERLQRLQVGRKLVVIQRQVDGLRRPCIGNRHAFWLRRPRLKSVGLQDKYYSPRLALVRPVARMHSIENRPQQ